MSKVKKLVLILAIFVLVAEVSKKAEAIVLENVQYIYYSM